MKTTIGIEHRELVNKFAGRYLVEQNEGDFYDGYLKLKRFQELNNDEFAISASNIVNVHQDFEEILVNVLIDYIESGIKTLINVKYGECIKQTPQVLENINWSELRNQKNDLLNSIKDFENKARESILVRGNELYDRYTKQVNSLTGILHLIDGLQDHAVGNMGIDENEVFDLEDN